MCELDWDAIAEIARDTGKPICIGSTHEYGRREKGRMSREAHKRNLNITLGNPKRNPLEKADELFVMAKL